ncbi:unnamed protein product, partial [marine sediment metagenome]
MHEHIDQKECEHILKYCKKCDVVYCEKCKSEWKKTGTTFSTWPYDGTIGTYVFP